MNAICSFSIPREFENRPDAEGSENIRNKPSTVFNDCSGKIPDFARAVSCATALAKWVLNRLTHGLGGTSHNPCVSPHAVYE